MSRPARSRLGTVLRVAELQETAARATLARAGAEVLRTSGQVDVARTGLAGVGLLTGPATGVDRSVQSRTAHAGAVTLAEETHGSAVSARADSFAGWQATARRRDALAGVVERHAELARAAVEKRDQHLADDLSAARMRQPRGGRA